jgi:undecaprenyl diphosphate synthase
VRTSEEQRLSGFLTWTSVYSELYFPRCYWPDFDEKELDKTIEEFERRNRRFGGD